jgi:hypothetical protein
MALGVLVAAILALLLRGLLTAGDGQTARLQGPVAARHALRSISREASCAFAPPVKDLAPLELSTSTEPAKPQVRLAFYAPIPLPDFPGAFDIHHVAYEVHAVKPGIRELRRIAVPCSGPLADAPSTNILLQGRFSMSIVALSSNVPATSWPPPSNETAPPSLPPSLLLSMDLPGQDAPLQTEVLIQAATGIRSPVERAPAADPVEE